MADIPTTTPSELPRYLRYMISEGHNPFVWGPPGSAKSAVTKQTAQALAVEGGFDFNDTGKDFEMQDPKKTFGFIDTRVSTADSSDIKGFGYLDVDNKKTTWLTPDCLPDVNVHGWQGWLFLDEFAQGVPLVTGGYSQLILDRHVGSYRLPAGWHIVAASNDKIHGCNTNRIGSHLNNRFGHVEMQPNADDWAANEMATGVGDARVCSFVRARPELLFLLEKDAKAFCSMRSWSSVSRAVKRIDDDADFLRTVIGSFVGTGPANEVMGYLALIAQGGEIPTWDQIRHSPNTAPVPTQSRQTMSLSFAIIGIIANNVEDVDDMDAVVHYIGRLEKDYAATLMHDLWSKDEDLFDCVAATAWRARNPTVVFVPKPKAA